MRSLVCSVSSIVQQMQEMNPGSTSRSLRTPAMCCKASYSSYRLALPATTTGSTNVVPGVNETPTTISFFDGVILIDGGAPAGAMEDAYQRLRRLQPHDRARYRQDGDADDGDADRQQQAMAFPSAQLFGIDGLDTWDPSFVATPVQGMVAVVIGPDYFDRVQNASTGHGGARSLRRSVPSRRSVVAPHERGAERQHFVDQIGSTVTPRW